MDDRAYAMISEVYGRIVKKPEPTEIDRAYIEGVLKALLHTYRPEAPKPESWWRKFLP